MIFDFVPTVEKKDLFFAGLVFGAPSVLSMGGPVWGAHRGESRRHRIVYFLTPILDRLFPGKEFPQCCGSPSSSASLDASPASAPPLSPAVSPASAPTPPAPAADSACLSDSKKSRLRAASCAVEPGRSQRCLAAKPERSPTEAIVVHRRSLADTQPQKFFFPQVAGGCERCQPERRSG